MPRTTITPFVFGPRRGRTLLAALLMAVTSWTVESSLSLAQEAKTTAPAAAKTETPAKSETPAKEAAPAQEDAATKVEDAAKTAAPVKTESAPSESKSADAPIIAPSTKAAPTLKSDANNSVGQGFLIVFALFVGSGLVGYWLSKAVQLPDQSIRFQIVTFAIAASIAILSLSWPPELGIDLSGGSILNFRVDRSKLTESRIDMDGMVSAINKRVNPGGVREVLVRPYGGDEIEVIIPSASQEKMDEVKRRITSSGALQFRIAADQQHDQAVADLAQREPKDDVYSVNSEGQRKHVATWFPVDKAEEAEMRSRSGHISRVNALGDYQVLVLIDTFNVTGEYLVRAEADTDQRTGSPCVSFVLNARGANLFGTLTGTNLQRQLSVILDGYFKSSATIQSQINGNGQITGNFTKERVAEQVAILQAGSLPAALEKEPTSEMFIGPTLGRDTIEKGVNAMLIGTIAVVIFMLIYYRFAGIVANIAVVLNVLLTVALMMMFHAAFTLAGLAGLALTVGMAVDANVLIYERMREELAKGSTLRMAIRNGFDRATTTIIDANVTTLIAGVVLYWRGTDQVKGFAVTLIIGLLTNLFTAITVSRVIFDTVEKNRWVKKLNMMQLMGQTAIDFIGYRKLAVAFSTIVIGVGLTACYVRGKDLFDIDFTGGTSVQVLFNEPHDVTAVRKAVQVLADATVQDLKTNEDPAHGYRFLIVTSESNTQLDEQNKPVDTHVVEKKLWKIFSGQLKSNQLSVESIKPLASAAPTTKQGAARALNLDTALAYAPEALLAQGDDKAKSDAAPAKAETKAEGTKEAPKTEPKATDTKATDTKAADTKAADTKAADVAKPAELKPLDPFAGGSLAKLKFTDKIGHPSLNDRINGLLQDSQQTQVLVEITNPQHAAGSSLGHTEWDVKLSLGEAPAKELFARLSTKLIEEPLFPASSQIGAQVAKNTQVIAVWAVIISLMLILAYVWFRFTQVYFGIAAIVAVIHDVLVTVGFVALSRWLAGPLDALGVDQFKINLTAIAAFLTIIGYSLNDTIVIFDRIREIRGKSQNITADLVNLSINQTLSRTLLTSLTVFITVTILYAVGGQGIHTFAFAMVIGTITGTYSTVYIATPIVLWLNGWKGSSSEASSGKMVSASGS